MKLFKKAKVSQKYQGLDIKNDRSNLQLKLKMKLWQRFESIGMGCVVGGLVCLISAQVVLSQDKWQQSLDINPSWYGEEYQQAVVADAVDPAMTGNLTIAMEDYTTMPQAVVILNGKEIKDFTNQQVTIKVASGDIIEIDSSAYQLPITFKIAKASANINTGFLEKHLTVKMGRATLGKVLFK